MSGRVWTRPDGVLGAKAVDGIVLEVLQKELANLQNSANICAVLICRVQANLEHEQAALARYQEKIDALTQAIASLSSHQSS